MSRKRRRKTPLYVAVILTLALLALGATHRFWLPIFKWPPVKIRAVEPMLPAGGTREGAQEAIKSEKTTLLKQFLFERGEDSLKEWEEKVFKGKTVFKVENEGGLCYLSSKSQDACSGLFVKTQEPPTADLSVSWKWRVHEFPQKKHPELLSNRAEDDFAARFSVIFLASNFFRSDVIEYIWDEKFPIGTSAESPYSERVKLLVIRSGPDGGQEGGWIKEERNLYEDYQKFFGKAPRNPVGMVAVMSDSDNTGTKASADFAEIVLKRKQPQKAV
jgi:hypothetical protein